MMVFLDTGILGFLCNPNANKEAIACTNWFEKLFVRGAYFVTSEVCNYETRRGLFLTGKPRLQAKSIQKLNDLKSLVNFLPVTQLEAELAAEIWAKARLKGTPTSSENSLDVDMIIVAHWQLLAEKFPGRYVVISTTNVKHLSLFAQAQEWRNISY
jgi:predicted nucleic acid-binding protein